MVTKKVRFLSLMLISTALGSEPNQSFYDYLNQVLFKSIPVKQTKPKNTVKKTAIKPEDLTIKLPKELDQKLLFVQLLQSEHPDKTFGTVLDKTGIESLELVSRGEQYAALSRKFGVKTLFGDIMLTSLLACPLTDPAAIKKRQAFIRALDENSQTLSAIERALQEIHDGQALLFSFFDDASKLDDELLIHVCPFGKNVPAIVGYKAFDRVNAAFGAISPLASMLSSVDTLSSLAKIIKDQPLTKSEKNNLLAGMTIGFNWSGIKRAPQTLLDLHNPYKMLEGTGPSLMNKAGWFAFGCARTLAYDAFIAWSYYGRFKNEKMSAAIHANMQTRLIGVGKVIRGLRDINTLLQQNKSDALVPECAPIAALFDGHCSAQLTQLINMLQKQTFEGEASYWSNGIRILRAYHLMCEHKQELAPALEAVGVVDAFTAVAHLKAHSPRNAHCYATIDEGKLPVISLHRFCNPLLPIEHAIPSTVALGINGDANIILTGPNGSGKSTNMKAIVLNVLLAQTFGIAAAESATITPFDALYTYINVQENIQEGMSTFMAEAQRLDEIDRAIAKTPSDKRCLTIVDEGMRGTVAAEGVARLCKVCTNICQVPQSVCIFATHFEEPTMLQKTTKGRWTNYHVEIEELTPGNFVRLHTLKRGTNNWWFTDEAKRKRFIDWLVKAK